MHYLKSTVWGNPANKLLGTYERELLPVWNELDERRPSLIFDVGAAEGYYAVGSLVRWPQTRVEAWEADELSQLQMRELARLNDAEDRLTVHGVCTPESLVSRLNHKAPDVILMDVEGSEVEICTPQVIRASARAVWVIEMHSERIVWELVDRFEPTHHLEIIQNEPRQASDCPDIGGRPLLAYDRWRLVQEGRPYPTPWLVAWPRGARRGAAPVPVTSEST